MTPLLRGIRGATTVDADDAEQIRLRTQELVREMLSRNDVKADDLVSIMFTATEDLNEEELAIFDLLTKPDPALTEEERDQVKGVAKGSTAADPPSKVTYVVILS